jgi:hypothetical protein
MQSNGIGKNPQSACFSAVRKLACSTALQTLLA